MPRLKYSLAFVTALITIGIVIGMVLIANFNMDSKSIAGESATKIYTEADTNWDSEGDETKSTIANFNPNAMFVDIVKKVRPSIVSIYTTKSVRIDQNPFYFFFREMPQDGDHPREQRQEGLGSGIIISKDGYILTNYHVIKEMDELKVMMIDNSEYEAKVIGSDPATEIALIKIEADDLPVAVLGNSDNVEIGANCTIDRAAFASTIIEDNVRIDNLVHIAHNCIVGKGCILVTQVGLSGSTILGERVVMGGQSATTGHLEIAPFSTLAGRAVATKTIKKSGHYAGFPLMDHRQWLKLKGKLQKLLKS